MGFLCRLWFGQPPEARLLIPRTEDLDLEELDYNDRQFFKRSQPTPSRESGSASFSFLNHVTSLKPLGELLIVGWGSGITGLLLSTTVNFVPVDL